MAINGRTVLRIGIVAIGLGAVGWLTCAGTLASSPAVTSACR
jgi:hypothetical protein